YSALENQSSHSGLIPHTVDVFFFIAVFVLYIRNPIPSIAHRKRYVLPFLYQPLLYFRSSSSKVIFIIPLSPVLIPIEQMLLGLLPLVYYSVDGRLSLYFYLLILLIHKLRALELSTNFCYFSTTPTRFAGCR